VNVPVVDAVWVTLPEAASVPLHVDPSAPPPPAMQDDAFDEFQVNVNACPTVTLVGPVEVGASAVLNRALDVPSTVSGRMFAKNELTGW